jgi:hypothetical protein
VEIGMRAGAFVVAVLLAVSSAAVADESSMPTSDERITQLEAKIEAAQKRLNDLQQVADQLTDAPTDKARTEAMKQQIREVLNEREFRESLMPSVVTAGYDDGFYIRSEDKKFSLKTNAIMQFRWTHYGTQSRNRYQEPRTERDDRTGFDMQRIRLIFSGNAWSPDLTYRFEFRGDSPDAYDVVVDKVYANYRFADEFQIRAGSFRIASTRAQVTSDTNFQFVDRPMTDAVFGLGIGLGVRFWGQLFNKRVEYAVDVVNSLNNDRNRTITPDPAEMDNHPALVFRTVWHALGDNPEKDFVAAADIPRHESPALDFGFHYAFNDDAGDTRTTRIPFPHPGGPGVGGFGLTSTNGLQINQFGWDAAFKYQGFSMLGEYLLRIVDPRHAFRRPFTPWSRLTGDGSTVAQHGAYVQAGYFLPIPDFMDKIELVARTGGVSALADEQEGAWEYSAGLNYYIQGNRIKLQTDVTKVYEAPISSPQSSLANVNDSALVWRVQLQVGL